MSASTTTMPFKASSDNRLEHGSFNDLPADTMNGSTTKVTFTAPPDNRLEAGSFNVVPADYPPTIDATSVDAKAVSETVVAGLNKALATKDYQALAALFVDDSYWRDHLCLSWDFHTLKGRETISSFLKTECRLRRVEIDGDLAHKAPQVSTLDVLGEVKCVAFFVKVVTAVGSGQGLIRLTTRDGEWKILTCFTTLKELQGHEEPRNSRRPTGHPESRDAKNWIESRTSEMNFEEKDPAVLILGWSSPLPSPLLFPHHKDELWLMQRF